MTFLLIIMAIRVVFYLLDSIRVDESEVDERKNIIHPSEFKTRICDIDRELPGWLQLNNN